MSFNKPLRVFLRPLPLKSQLISAQGEQQARELAQRLRGKGITAVVSSPENRTTFTASTITRALGLPDPQTDGSLTSKLPTRLNGGREEEPGERARRGLRAVEAFVGRTKGDVAIVSHGQARSLPPLKSSMVQRLRSRLDAAPLLPSPPPAARQQPQPPPPLVADWGRQSSSSSSAPAIFVLPPPASS